MNIFTNKYRTIDCGSLRIQNIEEEHTISGFVDTVRKLGGITFVVLRDFFGKMQVVLPEELNIELNKEDVVCVSGIVKERESKNNPANEYRKLPLFETRSETSSGLESG